MRLTVSDNGVGIPPDLMSRIFDPFFTTKELGRGTGLGLSTVFGIVNQSGGGIHVYSEQGQGTVFKVYLPRLDEELSGRKAAPELDDLSGSETILLVEDDGAVRRLSSRILTQAGYRVEAVPDGEAALDRFGELEEGIQLVITDVVMPGMSGLELVERLKAAGLQAPVLFMSGYTDDTIARHGVLEEGVELIIKPFGNQALLARVREVIDGHDEA